MGIVGRKISAKRRRAIEKNEDFLGQSEIEEREFVHHTGSCIIGACGEEAACKEFENNTYTCVCPHDSLPPTTRGTCPRKIVPVDPGRIPNVQPPSNKQSTAFNTTFPSVQHSTVENLGNLHYKPILGYITYTSISVVTILVLILYIRRKYCRKTVNNAEASPINLKQGLLVAERYTPNPQYSACAGTGIPVIRKETLKFLYEIGEGCFGKVWKGELLLENNDRPEIVAVKVLKETVTKQAEDNFIREVEIMSHFHHQNILSLVGMVSKENNVTAMIVFEYMPYGDLAELLRNQKEEDMDDNILKLSKDDLFCIALQIASGMQYLASQRFVHRDLACRNCLVAEGPTVKIADFGMSRDIYTCDYYRVGGSRLLPIRWMSPESVVYGRYTLESDIWSYGVVLWEIYSYGRQPYFGHNNDEAVKLILDGIILNAPDNCPPIICELMINCWKTEAKDRIRFSSICEKLELVHDCTVSHNENYEHLDLLFAETPSDKDDDDEDNDENDNDEKCADLAKNKLKETTTSTRTLPRPPPLPVILQEEVDAQGYLLAKVIKEPVQYLKTLPA